MQADVHARHLRGRPRLDAVLAGLVGACRTVGDLLEPFLPDAADRVRRQCGEGRRPPRPEPVFRRLSEPRRESVSSR